MKKAIALWMLIAVCTSAFGQKILKNQNATEQPFYGIGFEMGVGIDNSSVSQTNWEAMIRSMGVKRFSMRIDATLCEDFYRKLDFVQKINGEVLLVSEDVEGFAVLLKDLIVNKGYTCIKEVSLCNKPECDDAAIESYQKICKDFESLLSKEGIRDKLSVNCSGNIDTQRWFLEAAVQRSGEIADIFNSHNMLFDSKTSNSSILVWEKRNIEACKGKPHYVCDYDLSNKDGANSLDRVERGVSLTRIALNFINAGASGCSMYIPFDKISPMYYAYSLMTRFIPYGSDIHPVDLGNEFAACTMVKTPKGDNTWAFANCNDETLVLTVPTKVKLYKYIYSKETIPTDGSQIQYYSTVTPTKGELVTIEIPAWSTVYLTSGTTDASLGNNVFVPAKKKVKLYSEDFVAIVNKREMEDVKTLVLTAPCDIVYTPCCRPQEVNVFAPANEQEKVAITCNDGQMTVAGRSHNAKVYLSGPTASTFVNNSNKGNILFDSDVVIDGDVTVITKGAGSICFTGLSCKNLNITIEGNGNVDISALKADDVKINRKGKGRANIK